ncbi:MAG TPA: HAD hydrolase family protein [Solirubrobacteraceae bacterium]|nr:HAD hydrolase family protein [Solirubrobacteraceae bacterium]
MRCLYVDLDGTLLGPDGSLLTGADGRFSLLGVRALEACARAGAEVVLFSGRRQQSVFDAARLIGASAYIFEVGCGLVIDGELEWLTDGLEPSGAGSIYDQIEASGAPALLLERFSGSLEYHTPWSEGREVSHLFRGSIDLQEAARTLEQAGLGWLRLLDNGVIRSAGERRTAGDRRQEGVRRDAGEARSAAGPDAGGAIRAYHLIPAGASKARAVRRHMQARGYGPQDCIAVGDSREDLEAAEVVGGFWLVANALERDPTLAEEVAGRRSLRIASERYGAGVYEAVVSTLAERR